MLSSFSPGLFLDLSPPDHRLFRVKPRASARVRERGRDPPAAVFTPSACIETRNAPTGITRDIYDKKREQITQRREELGRLLEDSHAAANTFKVALSSLTSLASTVPALFESSNLALKGATLEYSLRKSFDLFVELADRQVWRPRQDSNLRPTD